MTGTRPTTGHTGAQVTAADPTQSVWVSANAGTGKTHVLTERILRLLLAGTAPGKILCLTYTKAAAAEAANRLSERLGHWAAAGKKDLAKDLKDHLGRAPADDESARARALFALTLEAPEGVTIRTIHSFCESLLGRFPVEAGIAPHFTVIDDGLAREIRAEAEARLLADRAGRPAAVTEALSRLAGLVDQDGFQKLMGELDSKRGRLRRMLDKENGVAGVMAGARAEMGLAANDTAESLLTAAAADGAFDREGLERAAKALDRGSPGDEERAAAIRAWLALEASRRAEAFEPDYSLIFATKDGAPRKNLATKKAQEVDPGAADVLIAE
ncbi:MAG: UvrD-helicase domain-containing protein, partial [Rhodospirillales bacterium]